MCVLIVHFVGFAQDGTDRSLTFVFVFVDWISLDLLTSSCATLQTSCALGPCFWMHETDEKRRR